MQYYYIIFNYLSAVRVVPVSKYEGGLLFMCVSFFMIPSVVTSVSEYDGGLLLHVCRCQVAPCHSLCRSQGWMRGTIYHDSHGGSCVIVMPRKEDSHTAKHMLALGQLPLKRTLCVVKVIT